MRSPSASELDFIVYCVDERGLSLSTALTYLHGKWRIEAFIGSEEIGVPETRRFIRESRFHPATKNSSLVGYKAYRKWEILEGYIEDGQVLLVPGPKVTSNPQPALTIAEARRVLEIPTTAPGIRLVWLGLFAGTRVSEAARIGQAEWLEDRLRFVGKGSKVRDVPLSPALAEYQEIILSASPSAGTLKHVCRSISYYAGIRFTSHALRRTFADQLREKGVPREVIGALLGHAPASVTERYAPVTWKEKVEAIQALAY